VNKVIPIIASTAPSARIPSGDSEENALYEIRKKIYPRAVTGWFANWRWVLVFATQLVYYGTPWLVWNDRQAVLFDLAARKFYIFGIVFWPQDFIYLTILLLISAFSLFLFTAVAGRLWCGYACPQTVYTEMFLWIERKIEGDFIAQKKLDQSPVSARKLGLKAAKHGVWITLSLWTGFTLVGYFTPIRDLSSSIMHLTISGWETFWVLFYGLATYGNAGWLREQVCKYMCPYARFQGAMFDRDTLVITYDAGRGETRGARGRKVDYKAKGLGDCVDCNICVQVCPTGIDIREGQQYECIGCTACIDGCNQVMDKMGYPRGLIRYATLNSVDQQFGWREMMKRVFRPRVVFYTVLLWAIIIATSVTLWYRVPVKVDVIRDRGAMSREVAGGLIENVYRLHLMNTQEKSQRLMVRVNGIAGMQIVGLVQPVEIAAAASKTIALNVRIDPANLPKGTSQIEFQIVAVDAEGREAPGDFSIREKATFFNR
jgi:cytochrome c oxidase accessory protein FixG